MLITILTTPNQSWQTFATYYSIICLFPNANIHIVCLRNKEITFNYYQWAKRLKIPISFIKQEHDDFLQRLFIAKQGWLVTPNIMFLDQNLPTFEKGLFTDKEIWYINTNLENITNDFALTGTCAKTDISIAKEAKETEEIASVVTYGKGCGSWINTLIGCPFSTAQRFVTENMTVNEMRIINLWRKMTPLFSVVT